MYIVHFTMYIVHTCMYIVQCKYVQCTLYILACKLYNVSTNVCVGFYICTRHCCVYGYIAFFMPGNQNVRGRCMYIVRLYILVWTMYVATCICTTLAHVRSTYVWSMYLCTTKWVAKIGRWVAKIGWWVAKLGRRVAKIGRWVSKLGRWVFKFREKGV